MCTNNSKEQSSTYAFWKHRAAYAKEVKIFFRQTLKLNTFVIFYIWRNWRIVDYQLARVEKSFK